MGSLNTIAFIIFGLKRRDKDHGGALPAACEHCRNDVMLHPYGWRTWFHIFWIPIIPWTATRTLTCPICGSSVEVDKQSYEEAIELATLAKKASDGLIPKEEFWRAYDDTEIDSPAYGVPDGSEVALDDRDGSSVDAGDDTATAG